jgi:rod shape determining protein RodA
MAGLLPAPIRALPWSMLLTVCAITTFGLATLYSAAGGRLSPWAINQAARFSVLFAGMLGLSLVPVATWKRHAYTLHGITLALLIVVELFGHIGMGAQRWIDLGIVRLQPSELMKLAVVLTLARFYDSVPASFISQPGVLIIPAAIVGVPAALVMLQPDLGTAMMITLAGVTIIFLAGTLMRWLIGAGTILAAMLPIAWGLLHDYQKNRILIFMNPESDPLGTGYHLTQSKIAIGSGGVLGKGFLQGTQSHLEYLPETHTDFIFATMMEEWAWSGAS